MAIIRRNKRRERDFSIIDNSILQNQDMTYEARGLLCYLLSKPDDWQCRMTDLQKANKAGRDKVRRILKELKGFGYATFQIVRTDKGVLRGKEWVIHEEPVSRKPENPSIGNRKPENPTVGFPDGRKTPTSGKPAPLISTDSIQSTKQRKKKEDSPSQNKSSSPLNTSSYAVGNRHGARPDFDPVAHIVGRLQAAGFMYKEDWKKKGVDESKIEPYGIHFAQNYIKQKGEGLSDTDFESLLKRTGDRYFLSTFPSSFTWISEKINRAQKIQIQQTNILPKAKMNYV